MERLDEPQKPVVPQYVADWYETCKNNTLESTFTKFNNLKVTNPVKRWLQKEGSRISSNFNSGAQTIIAKARILGYEVEEQTNMNELVEKVKQWGKDKNITDPLKQIIKVQEEVGETSGELLRYLKKPQEHEEALKDGIGDSLVTLIILADTLGFDAIECLQDAYDVIADRKGKTIDGTFYKEEDFKR